MGDLYVQVELYGSVVEDRVIPVRTSVVLGDWPSAAVGFPGASLQVSRAGNKLRVLGMSLQEGEGTHIEMGSVCVRISHTSPRARIHRGPRLLDRRFLATAIVMVGVGGWIDATEHWVDRVTWSTTATEESWVRDLIAEPQRLSTQQVISSVRPTVPNAAQMKSSTAIGEGPQHRSDDRVTGIGYSAWFRHMVPADPRIDNADLRLLENPGDVEARSLIARHAYHSGHFDLAQWHYQTLLDANPNDRAAQIRLAWTLRRQGMHQAEFEVYQHILAVDPSNIHALSGASSALMRLGRPGEAYDTFDALQILAPSHPLTDTTGAIIAASQGDEIRALKALSRAINAQEQLDTEMQIEFRQDIAADPVFARLRADSKLGALLRRTMGAAAPRRLTANARRMR